jgi:putative FmdB family regulatory protein
MPIYEYRCLDCGKRNALLILSPSNPPALTCRHCSGARLERIMSRFAAPKSEEARLESLADPSRFSDLDESDPRSMARMMKRMGQEMGEDFGDELDEAMEEGGPLEDEAGAGDDVGGGDLD